MSKLKNTLIFSSLFAILFFSVFFNACKNKKDDFVLDYKYEYFPLDSGRYWIWETDSIRFEPLGSGNVKSDTGKYFIKEVVESIYNDNAGRPTARIERYRSETSTPYNWYITDIWFANLTNKTGEKVEENLRFVKLIFPPKNNQTWKGNQYVQVTNNIEWLNDWTYSVESLDVPATYNNLNFDSTITVLQNTNENLIEKSFSTETYAKNVGLVYKELLRLEKTNVTNTWEFPEKGFILKMTIKEFSN
jgi:hypothetical protein